MVASIEYARASIGIRLECVWAAFASSFAIIYLRFFFLLLELFPVRFPRAFSFFFFVRVHSF